MFKYLPRWLRLRILKRMGHKVVDNSDIIALLESATKKTEERRTY